MDFHLDRKVALSLESKYESLYKWSLHEQDDDGKQLGLDQVPWDWSLMFTATELALNENLELKVETPPFSKQGASESEKCAEEKITTEERNFIRAELRPAGNFTDPDGGALYSMFGTDRAIKSFQLWIYQREDETKPEHCSAWGSLSYTLEIDFHKEVVDDILQFNLHVSAARFAQYVEMMRNHPADIMTLRLRSVDGLYSEWSPSIFTDRIKVLTNIEDHQVTIPEGCTIKPPTLGRIGEFSLTFVTRRSCDQPTR